MKMGMPAPCITGCEKVLLAVGDVAFAFWTYPVCTQADKQTDPIAQ